MLLFFQNYYSDSNNKQSGYELEGLYTLKVKKVYSHQIAGMKKITYFVAKTFEIFAFSLNICCRQFASKCLVQRNLYCLLVLSFRFCVRLRRILPIQRQFFVFLHTNSYSLLQQSLSSRLRRNSSSNEKDIATLPTVSENGEKRKSRVIGGITVRSPDIDSLRDGCLTDDVSNSVSSYMYIVIE